MQTRAMEFLKTSRPTFYRWLKAGRIQGFKVGKTVAILQI
ncbi:MAG: helix-turn-helix domain-containing protein [Candidatus Xenobiia bacterium LiM19]